MGGNSDGRYTIRLIEPEDETGFLELYETVFDGGSSEWFRWKYVNNPYLTHIPIFVAESDGRIVGARPYMAFRLVVGTTHVLGLQTGDTMVHPDHRRQGLFKRMTGRSFDYYGRLPEEIITFNVPNALSRPGYLDLGCVEVGQLPVEYRVQRPSTFIDGDRTEAVRRLGRYTAPVIRKAIQSAETLSGVPDDITVRRHREIPIDTFVSLYERAVPDGVHALRDSRFYEWRFNNPMWNYTPFTVHRDGHPIGGMVVGEQVADDRSVVYLTEVLPLSSEGNDAGRMKAILATVCREFRDADIVAMADGDASSLFSRRYGFLPDDRLPLSKLTTPTILITKVLNGSKEETYEIEDVNLRDLESWHLTLSERNTS